MIRYNSGGMAYLRRSMFFVLMFVFFASAPISSEACSVGYPQSSLILSNMPALLLVSADDPPKGGDQAGGGSDRDQPERADKNDRPPREGDFSRRAHGDRAPDEKRDRFMPMLPNGSHDQPEQMMGRAMEIIRIKLPTVHARLQKLQRRNPERFEQAMRNLMPMFFEYMTLRDQHPELAEGIIQEFRNEEQLRQLSRKFKQAQDKPDEQAEIGRQIERLVAEQFDLRVRRQVVRLEEFERRIREQQRRLEEQRARFQEESKKRDELISRRVQEVKEGKVSDSLLPKGQHSEEREGGFRHRSQHGAEPGERPPPGPPRPDEPKGGAHPPQPDRPNPPASDDDADDAE